MTISGSDFISVIDTVTNTVVDTVTLPAEGPFAVAVHPDGTRVYVGAGDLVSVIDTVTNTVVDTVTVGRRPVAAAVNSDGTRIYVANQLDASVSVIDTVTNAVVASVPVGTTNGVAVTPDRTRAYATNSPSGLVSVIDTVTNTVIATISVGGAPVEVAITPDGTRAYVANQLDASVSVIDTVTNAVVATVAVGGGPSGVAITPFRIITVVIDIKPGSDPNCFNNDGYGVIPVAIQGSADFDVRGIDPETVSLAALPVKAVGMNNKLLSHIGDMNTDGFDDLVVQIEDQDGLFAPGESTAILTGNLFDGTAIEGADSICVVP